MTLITLSVIKTIGKKANLRQLLGNFWDISFVSFGHTTMKNEGSFFRNLPSIIWILSMIVMLKGFSVLMLRFFMEPIPKEVIDSWDELYLKKDVKIMALELSFMTTYVKQFSDEQEMARDFGTRMIGAEQFAVDYYSSQHRNSSKNETIKLQEYYHTFDDKIAQFMDLIESGKYVLTAQKYQLETSFMIWAKDLGVNTHISRTGGVVSPYFLGIRSNQNCLDLEADINKL